MFKATTTIISAVFLPLILLQGCASSSIAKEKPPSVTSTPSGADVFANLLELGKTPLQADLYDAFPASWQNSIYQAQGVLVVKKDGCKDFTLKVSDFILSKPIHAELECSVAEKPKTSTAVAAPEIVKTPIVTTHGSTEKRLEEVEALRQKGVITEDEYKKTRERILSEI